MRRSEGPSPQSLNRPVYIGIFDYTYALNNPTTLTDPSGLDAIYTCPACTMQITVTANGDLSDALEQLGPGDPMLQAIFDMDSCLEWGNCYQAENTPSGGGGGGLVAPPSQPKPNIITWPQLQKLVAANNKSNQCAELIDCIVFRESHVGLSGGKPRLTLANGLGAGFETNAGASVPHHALGLMQLESCDQGGPCASYNPLDPAQNIQVGSRFLQQKINHFRREGGVRHYGPPEETDYASRVLDCVKKLKAGNVGGAYEIATKP